MAPRGYPTSPKVERRKRLSQEDGERIEPQRPPFVGIVEPPPPYQAGPRRKLPSWAKHLRDLRRLTLVE